MTDVNKTQFRIRAAQDGQSTEAEVCAILRRELEVPAEQYGLGSGLVACFHEVAIELPLPERHWPPKPSQFDEPP